MFFLAHRANLDGVNCATENTRSAFGDALAAGFGLETDVRDAAGHLVISHDPPTGTAPTLADLLALHRAHAPQLPLALNIKSDGLRQLLRPLLAALPADSYFCFDMSVPETLAYRREGFTFFTRHSDIETVPVLYVDAAGVWLDMFLSDWVTPDIIRRHLDAGKKVALVSPELHKRPYPAFWETMRSAGLGREINLMLCTDHPRAARQFFHD